MGFLPLALFPEKENHKQKENIGVMSWALTNTREKRSARHPQVPAASQLPGPAKQGKKPNTPVPGQQPRGFSLMQETQQPGMLQDFGEQVTPPGRHSSGWGGTQLLLHPTPTKRHAAGVFGFFFSLAFHPNVALG